MKDHVRRAVAYIVLRLSSDNGVASVHDHSVSKAFRYDAEVAVAKTKITFVEPETGGKISGLGGAGIFTVTDEASGKKVSLKLKPDTFDGFDYGSVKPFFGTCDGKLVSIRDSEHGKDFQYSGG